MAEAWIFYIKNITRRDNLDIPRKNKIETDRIILRSVSKSLIPS